MMSETTIANSTFVSETANLTNLTIENSTFVFNRYDILSLFQEFHPAYNTIDRLITPIWLIIGFITNPISAKIWMQRNMKRNNSSAVYLTAVSICDFVFLVLYVLTELDTAWGVTTINIRHVCNIFYFFFYWPQYLSPLLVLGFTVERYIAVVHPFKKERFCTNRRAWIVVIGFTIFTMMLCIMQPFAWHYDDGTAHCNTPLHLQYIMYIWNWVTEMLIFGFVPVCVLVFNIRVLMEIKRLARQSGSMLPYQQGSGANTAASTITLLCVSFYLILTTLPVTLVYILQNVVEEPNMMMTDAEIHVDPVWQKWFMYMTVKKLVDEICLSHYCCYFFIYIFTGTQFRNALKAWVCSYSICQKRIEKGKYKTVNGHEGYTVTSYV